jgi:GNAT superfamily N-acetyltransferase
MPDLLVPLYKLPPREQGELAHTNPDEPFIRRANPFETTRVTHFITHTFSRAWADEVQTTFSRQPITCYIAVDHGKVIGFAAYEATRRAYFGPTGVETAYRGRGLGKRLLVASLWGLWDLGYAYGIIGSAGPVEFYERTVGAIVIPDSSPGIYNNLLK